MGRFGPLVSGAVYEAKLGSKLISFLWSSAVREKLWRKMKGREEERGGEAEKREGEQN